MKENDAIIAERRRVARRLHDAFQNIDGLIPGPMGDEDFGGTFHLFLLRVDPEVIRGGVMAFKEILAEKGVTQIAHFCPMYHFRLFKELGYDAAGIASSCPNAERVFFQQYTHLPIYGLPEGSVEHMIESVVEAAGRLKK